MNRTEADLREFYAELPVSDDVEPRLQHWISQSGNWGSEKSTASSRSSRSRSLAVAAAVAAAATVALVAGVLTWRARSPQPRPPVVTSTTDTFLTVAYNGPGIGPDLQLRRASDGSLMSTVLRTAANSRIDATRTADGELLVAVTSGCTTTLERVDPASGRTTSLRVLAEPVFDMTLSPDGEKLAYLTQTSCVPVTCPGVCHGPQQGPPTVLVVLDLRSGRSVRAATANFRHALSGLSWSPDADDVVVGFEGNARKLGGYAGPKYELVILDAADPDFHTARHVPNQPGCSYFAPAWTEAGIVAAEGCRPDPGLSQDRLVRITAAGAVSAQWPLPICSGVGITRTSPSHESAFVQISIGYGNGSCGKNWATRISRINGPSLQTVINMPGASDGVRLDG